MRHGRRQVSVDGSRDAAGAGAQARSDTSADGGDPRLTALVVELRSRLRRVCRDWDDATFETLVLSIARSKLRWDGDGYRS